MPSVKHRLRCLLGLALMAFSASAVALGLGEMRVKSSPGAPLLAEIAIVSSEPGELEQVSARLASPATFERVGLPRPQGLVNDLDFSLALDETGRPVIRVTSRVPVDQPVVNFLIEVDWGQGRLVREYSALVQAPGTMAAGAQPVIQAPVPPPSNAIVRPPQPAVAATPAPEAPPVPASTPVETPQAPPPAPRPVAAAPSPAFDDGSVQVQRGQTLSHIAAQVRANTGQTLNQAMVALLQANPDAFIGGNINRLKEGAVLRVPQAGETPALDAQEAAALVRLQTEAWRQARQQPVPQPAVVGEAPAAPAPASPRPATPAVAGARLEIAPPSAAGTTTAGTQSGNQAGGEGDMLANEQLQQTREDLAARDTEIEELRAQVAELEKLKEQQDALIALKDSDLAAAQQRLAESQGGASGMPAWLWGGLGLLLLGVVAWGLLSRRKARTDDAAPAQRYDSAALAAAMPERAADDVDPEPEAAPSPAPTKGTGPTWHSGGSGTDPELEVAHLNPAPAGRDRLELAVAYLDLGDVETARDLLHEVLQGDDPVAGEEAARLLNELD